MASSLLQTVQNALSGLFFRMMDHSPMLYDTFACTSFVEAERSKIYAIITLSPFIA